MNARLLPLSPLLIEHVSSLTAKSLARTSGAWESDLAPRHAYPGLDYPDDSGSYAEAWRFPVVEPWFDENEPGAWNVVTFVFRVPTGNYDSPVFISGLPFPQLRLVRLAYIDECSVAAGAVILPAGRTYDYLFIRDGNAHCDPLNPQRKRTLRGAEVSTFFTDSCFQAVSLQPWEAGLLRRITNHIMPFNTKEDELFLANPGGGSQTLLTKQIQRLDHSVGVVNYIDKVIAREERHHAVSYRICLAQINRILRERNPYEEPAEMDREFFVQLYEELANNDVKGWNYDQYQSPAYFLSILRRHTWTGAFCHPKYGGNAGCMGWNWLSDRFPFNWTLSQERPCGESSEYLG